MTKYAPILLFVYNRPEHLKQTMETLQNNTLAAESELYIYSDAARKDTDEAAVAEVRNYIHKITGFKSITLIEREKNWGLARNIIDGVTTQVNRFGRVIVMEDDLITAPYFLQFMNDALETYKDEPRVGHIQACDFTNDPSLPDTFLIKFTGSWGWATWDRAWKYFNPDGKELLRQLEERNLTRRLSFHANAEAPNRGKKQFMGHPLECQPVFSRYPLVKHRTFTYSEHRFRWKRHQLRWWRFIQFHLMDETAPNRKMVANRRK